MNSDFIKWVVIGGVGVLLLAMPSRKWSTPAAGQPYEVYFELATQQFDLPAGLLSRVAYQESRYDVSARSSAGAAGIMQIVPRWHPGVTPTDADPVDDIFYAGRYLHDLHTQFGGWRLALAAYNWGPGNLSRAISEYGVEWPNAAPAETQQYVHDVAGDVGLPAEAIV